MIKKYKTKGFAILLVLGFLLMTGSITWANSENTRIVTSQKIIESAETNKNSIILYTIVNSKLAKFLVEESNKKKIPCFGVLGDLILNFSKLLNQKASHEPSGQHVLNKEYYDRIEAIQFTMNHDDGKNIEDIEKSDIVLLGVSRTSKTPTSIYLANRGYKTSNIPLINEKSIPEKMTKLVFKSCVVGLTTEADRLFDIRKNSWPTIDVTRKSVEETAASIIKIYEIKNKKNV